MKYLLILITLLALSGCTEKVKEIVYVDVNGTPITKYYKQMPEPEIVCDKRGYAYHKQNTYNYTYIYTPILVNKNYGAYQVKCEDLK